MKFEASKSSLLHSRVLLVPLVHLLLLVAGLVGPAVPLVELGLLRLPEHLESGLRR